MITRSLNKLIRQLVGMLIFSWLVAFATSCGDKGDKNNEGGNCSPGQCCGPNCGNDPGKLGIQATADLSGAFGLLVLDNEENANLTLIDKHNETVEKLGLTAPKFAKEVGAELSGDSNVETYSLEGQPFTFPKPKGLALTDGESTDKKAAMQKIDSTTGEIKDALSQDKRADTNVYDPNRKLPKLKTIAVSPTKEVYLHFENPFIYRDAQGTEDPWNMSNGFQCQVFKVKGGTLDDLLVKTPDANNLECIDNAHFINGWQSFSNGVFQFDSTGNLYYPGSLPNGGKMIVYRRERDGSQTKEMINANICVQNFLVTDGGGIFYTGNTCQTDGNMGGGGGGFFRYISPGDNGSIIEIARDWWNFIYDTSVTANQTDTAVFFGPDPRNSNTASWNSACLFKFDPAQTDTTTRISEVITCGNNIWDWMNMTRAVDVTTYGYGYNNKPGGNQGFTPSLDWKKEYKRRCETKDEVFAGGGSQISAIQQDSTGKTYVIGNIRKKAEGKVSCSVSFRGPHCSISNIPVLNDDSDVAYTETACVADNGTWINKGTCSNQSTDGDACMGHSRSWTSGFCSNPDYATKEACEAAAGCSNRWYTDQTACTNAGFNWHPATTSTNGLVWRTGRCSSDEDIYETQAACEGSSKTWNADNWAGSCTSTDSADNASLYNNNKSGCVPEWSTEQVWYNNVSGDICTTEETADRDTFWDWNSKDNHFAQTASSTQKQYNELSPKFIVDRVNCEQVSSTGGSSGEWTTEYSALASIDADSKSLKLLSLSTEKAIDLWLVEDKPYYSSFDTSLGQYTLNGLNVSNICNNTAKTSESSCNGTGESWEDRKCLMTGLTSKSTCEDAGYVWQMVHPYTIISNFETYNLAESGVDGQLFADGLDFKDNQYKFGTVDIVQKILSLKQGLTGTLKTIVILPKD